MLRKFDGALMINPDNRILILFHLYRSSKHKFIATVANVENAESCWHFDWVFLCILFLYIVYGWITILGYSKYELGTINLLYSNPKICYITPLPPPPPAHRPPLHNDRFLLSPRWPFWRGSTVYPFSARHHMSFQLQSKLSLRPLS